MKIFIVFLTLALLSYPLARVQAAGPEQLPSVPADQIAKVAEALPEKPLSKPARRRALMLWQCKGYYHSAISITAKAIEMMGEKTGAYELVIPLTQSNQLDYLQADKLKEFDAVIFNNNTRLGLNKAQQDALLNYVKEGGGIVGVHAATDNFYNWPEGARMMGGLFSGHPWHEEVPVKIVDTDSKLTSMFDASGFKVTDEIYQFRQGFYSRDNQRVLLALDYEKMDKMKGDREDSDYAISWVKRYGKGRIFYCSLGHDNWIFWNSAILEHFLAGIQFALGDLDVNTEPNPISPRDIDPYMGIYTGAGRLDGKKTKAAARVIARGNGEYELSLTAPPEISGKSGVRLVLRTSGVAGDLDLYADAAAKKRGVNYSYYEGQWSSLPDFDKLSPVKKGVVDNFTLDPRSRSDNFAFKFDGFIKIEEAGRYGFETNSDDGSRLYIGDKMVVDNDGMHGEVRKSGVIELSKGVHPVTVTFFEASGGELLRVGMSKASEKDNKQVLFSGSGLGAEWDASLKKDRLTLVAKEPGKGEFRLKYIERESPSLGLEPPEGAVELLPRGGDGRPSLDEWSNKSWLRLPDGSIQVAKGNNSSESKFGDAMIHLEFMCPYLPARRGQDRGNSGVYIQGRYELQVLDSFGLKPADNLCGGVYKIAAPRVNATLPPLHWQTYDIVFKAHRFNADGSLATDAVFEEVKLNGISIHKNVVLPHTTTSGLAGNKVAEGPLLLQDHGSPVRYRNIWIKPLD